MRPLKQAIIDRDGIRSCVCQSYNHGTFQSLNVEWSGKVEGNIIKNA